MPRFKVTIKRSAVINTVAIEKGMEVEIVSQFPQNPVIYNQGKAVQDAFLRIYGIDLKSISILNLSYLDVKQI